MYLSCIHLFIRYSRACVFYHDVVGRGLTPYKASTELGVLSSNVEIIIYYWLIIRSNTNGATSRTGTDYPSGTYHVFSEGLVAQS